MHRIRKAFHTASLQNIYYMKHPILFFFLTPFHSVLLVLPSSTRYPGLQHFAEARPSLHIHHLRWCHCIPGCTWPSCKCGQVSFSVCSPLLPPPARSLLFCFSLKDADDSLDADSGGHCCAPAWLCWFSGTPAPKQRVMSIVWQICTWRTQRHYFIHDVSGLLVLPT